MRTLVRVLIAGALTCTVTPRSPAQADSTATPVPVLHVDAAKVTAKVSPMLYGLMTEEINYSYEGGLYAELIANRSFYSPGEPPAHWSAVETPGSPAVLSLDETQPVPGTVLTKCLKLEARSAAPGHRAGVANEGYWGIPVRPRTVYRLSFYARTDGAGHGPLTASIESNDGARVFATATVPAVTTDWKKYTLTLTTAADAPTSASNRFVLSTEQPGTFWVNLVSLFPPTYHDRPNGNRPDLMGLLADMNAKFLRLPGGNFLEGNLVEDRFPWKQTLGPLEQRPGHRGCWNYGANDGMGLLEFLEWCEDLHIEPVLAVYAGYSLKKVHVEPGADLQPFVVDALDEIEYVVGGADTRWGAERAKDGHPAPFALHYVEIGNEDGFDHSGSYENRYVQFYDAIKAKYPSLQCISTTGGSDFAGKRYPITKRTPDVIDEHYYRNAWEMEDDATHYDAYDRKGPKIFVGEWATREGKPTTNMNAALGDAAWLTGMERNSDLVVMASYAPLFVNVNPGGMQWSSDLIGYDVLNGYGSPSYYVQSMFNTHLGESVLSVTGEGIPTQTWRRAEPKGKPTTDATPTPPPSKQAETQAVKQTPPPSSWKEVPTLFFVATKTASKGAIYLKVVNTADHPQPVRIEIAGAARLAPEGTALTLRADQPTDTNSITEPKKIVPVSEPVRGVGSDFTRTFPPYSVTVLELADQPAL